jgi:hypothetical protein
MRRVDEKYGSMSDQIKPLFWVSPKDRVNFVRLGMFADPVLKSCDSSFESIKTQEYTIPFLREFFMEEVVPKGKHVVIASIDIGRVYRFLATVVSMKKRRD